MMLDERLLLENRRGDVASTSLDAMYGDETVVSGKRLLDGTKDDSIVSETGMDVSIVDETELSEYI